MKINYRVLVEAHECFMVPNLTSRLLFVIFVHTLTKPSTTKLFQKKDQNRKTKEFVYDLRFGFSSIKMARRFRNIVTNNKFIITENTALNRNVFHFL